MCIDYTMQIETKIDAQYQRSFTKWIILPIQRIINESGNPQGSVCVYIT